MTTRTKIVLTLLIAAAWVFFLLPFTLFGVLSVPAFVVVVLLTAVALVAIWTRLLAIRPRGRRREHA